MARRRHTLRPPGTLPTLRAVWAVLPRVTVTVPHWRRPRIRNPPCTAFPEAPARFLRPGRTARTSISMAALTTACGATTTGWPSTCARLERPAACPPPESAAFWAEAESATSWAEAELATFWGGVEWATFWGEAELAIFWAEAA